MPKITAASIGLTALVLVALTGCAGTPGATPSETPEPSPSVTVETTDAENVAEAAPMTVEPIEAAEPTKDELQSLWYGRFGKTLQSYGYDFPLIGDSLPVGQYICDQSRAGVAPENIHAVQGLPAEHEYANTQIVDLTLNNGTVLTDAAAAAGETLPDYCGVLFPAA